MRALKEGHVFDKADHRKTSFLAESELPSHVRQRCVLGRRDKHSAVSGPPVHGVRELCLELLRNRHQLIRSARRRVDHQEVNVLKKRGADFLSHFSEDKIDEVQSSSDEQTSLRLHFSGKPEGKGRTNVLFLGSLNPNMTFDSMQLIRK